MKFTMFGGTVKITPLGAVVIAGSILVLFIFYTKSNSKKLTGTANYEVSLKQILTLGIQLSERAGDEIRKIHDKKLVQKEVKGKTKEGAEEYLTAADKRSHTVIVRGLEKAFPGIKVISEEHNEILEDIDTIKLEDIISNSELEGLDVKENIQDLTIWVDPLDATQEFTENLLEYVTVLICVAVKDEPLIGIIHQPFEKNTVWGWSGIGTSKNLQIAKVSSKQKHRIIVSRSHAGDVKNVALNIFGNETEIIPAGGAGYKTLQVIKGNADAYIHITLIKKWDICAPNAVLNSVQGQMTTINGQNIDYKSSSPNKNDKGVLATLHNHKEYLNLLKAFTN